MVTMVGRLDAKSVAGAPLPFARLIAFGFYDGPTSGIAEYDGGTAAYRFDLLAIDTDGSLDRDAWDRGEELRVYELTPLEEQAFARIVAVLAQEQEPRWPVWVLGGESGTDTDDRWDQVVAPLLRARTPPELVVASAGLLGPVVAARSWPAEGHPGEDGWGAYLGLGRS